MYPLLEKLKFGNRTTILCLQTVRSYGGSQVCSLVSIEDRHRHSWQWHSYSLELTRACAVKDVVCVSRVSDAANNFNIIETLARHE